MKNMYVNADPMMPKIHIHEWVETGNFVPLTNYWFSPRSFINQCCGQKMLKVRKEYKCAVCSKTVHMGKYFICDECGTLWESED